MNWCKKINKEESEKFLKDLDFFSTHNHTEISNFRLRDCIIKIPQLINRAIDLGYKGVCITDHEALTGHVRFIRRYKELKKLRNRYLSQTPEENEKDKEIQDNLKYLINFNDSFKIGLGNEIYLINSMEDVTTNYVSGETKFWHFILIAKDKIGYEQIERISSESAWKNWFKRFRMEWVPTVKSEMEEIIGDNKGHIIAQSACLGSELDNLILKYLETNDINDKRKIHNFITWAINLFGKENFFLEIQPCKLKYDENGNPLIHPQVLVNQFMFVLSKAYGLSIVVSTDSHFLSLEDKEIHASYLRGDDDDKSKGREAGDFYDATYMFDKIDLVQTLSEYLTLEQIKQALDGTMKVWDMIEEIDLSHPVIVPTDKKLPKFELRHTLKPWYKKYEYIKKYAESDNIQDQYLFYLVENGMDNMKQWEDSEYVFETYDENGRLIEQETRIVTLEQKIARLNEEFSSFWQISEKVKQPLSAYYVLVRGLCHEVIWKHSYLGTGRGSAGGSFICYLIEITQINPLKLDLPFWRHSSPLRPELPD